MEESNNIELKSVEELKGYSFFIPDYQRGYRWTPKHVQDLLNDIDEFKEKNEGNSGDFYCIQPLVIKKIVEEDSFIEKIHSVQKPNVFDKIQKLLKSNCKWEVIDGQQRLTTIHILLSYLKHKNFYNIEYKTRKNSKTFIENISSPETEKNFKENIDFYHVYTTYKTIEDWFKDKVYKYNEEFVDILLKKVKFIWYEVPLESNSIEIFNRLNIGKISLTNSELIKALLLNRKNFKNDENIINKQKEIASQWDNIEYTLQNDEFWFFLNNKKSSNPTRIDMIFDLIFEENELKVYKKEENTDKKYGKDEYKTFRYFYNYFKSNRDKECLDSCWKEVKMIFDIFYEWFNDLELYHYIGYILETQRKIQIEGNKKQKEISLNFLLKEWNSSIDKDSFIGKLKNLIKKFVKIDKLEAIEDKLDEQYTIENKRSSIPLLLLHNIQTIIIQNKNLKNKDKYKQSVFYKFPFHLYKKEDWDVEHICSYTDNDFDNDKTKREYLSWVKFGIKDKTIENKIDEILNKKESIALQAFNELKSDIERYDNDIKEDDKNKIWNFVLLDSSTNRSYGNDIFASKRRIIIGKDQGKKYVFEDNKIGEKKIDDKDKIVCFIPICTRNVFFKYYTLQPNNLTKWTKEDAKNYKENIIETLKELL